MIFSELATAFTVLSGIWSNRSTFCPDGSSKKDMRIVDPSNDFAPYPFYNMGQLDVPNFKHQEGAVHEQNHH